MLSLSPTGLRPSHTQGQTASIQFSGAEKTGSKPIPKDIQDILDKMPPDIFERDKRKDKEQPAQIPLELPLPSPPPPNAERKKPDEAPQRGVIIIDINGNEEEDRSPGSSNSDRGVVVYQM